MNNKRPKINLHKIISNKLNNYRYKIIITKIKQMNLSNKQIYMKQMYNYKKIIYKIINKLYLNNKNVLENQNINLKNYNKNMMIVYNKYNNINRKYNYMKIKIKNNRYYIKIMKMNKIMIHHYIVKNFHKIMMIQLCHLMKK